MASNTRHTIDAKDLHVTSIFAQTGERAVIDHAVDKDEEVLIALGYLPEFKRCRLPMLLFSYSHSLYSLLLLPPLIPLTRLLHRDFSLWSSFSVSFSVLGLLPSIASTLGYNFGYAGPAGAVWGWVVAGILIQFVALSMAELCSSMPTAGGLYYASAVLGPEGWGPLCAWVGCLFLSLSFPPFLLARLLSLAPAVALILSLL